NAELIPNARARVARVLELLHGEELGISGADDTWIERAHRLGRFDSRKAARPIIVAFSSYRHIETIMANVSKLRDTDFSVNRDFPTEITRARKVLWPKLKQLRQKFPSSQATLAYPAKIILDGRVVEDMFPEWDDTLRGSRIDAAHPSQQTFKHDRSRSQSVVIQARNESIVTTPAAWLTYIGYNTDYTRA
ncbi:MAG: hypothetical protein JAZ03_22875, partial [Candidatus Thiodiazotropha taylori]|nr:hypothetical protein [Candidatus Thiodiazotropha taylori]MCW4336775.1 hypothetical protein [Candidatus Thiodiazotropha endolucinida]